MAEYTYRDIFTKQLEQEEEQVKKGVMRPDAKAEQPKQDFMTSFVDILKGYTGEEADRVLSPKKIEFDIDAFYREFDELTLRSSEEAALQRMESGVTESLAEPARTKKLKEGESLVPKARPEPDLGSTQSKGLMSMPVADGVQPTAGKAWLSSELDTILVSEGGFQDDKEDDGNYVNGKLIGTNKGITPAALAEYRGVKPSTITVEDIKGITEQEARDIYEQNYYYKPKIDKLPEDIQASVFDMNINAGSNAIKILQRLAGVKQDGVIGPQTIKAVQEAGITPEQYADARIEYYKKVVKSDPKKKKYLDGWINRANKYRGS